MTETLKVLGQSQPGATSLTDAYTVPALTQASVSSIVVCNTDNAAHSFRVSVAVGGAADDPSQYLYYDCPIVANDTFVSTIGVSLGPADVVRVYSDAGDLAFTIFGVEVT